ncbi:MAG: group II intron reverse transcriptase/maturase, partial [Bacteroidales bacterium]|nr:group II intron reverse transcriptase/maturase [Bacteroidales bacterium]
EVLSKDNLNQAYLQVTRNKGASGVDDMTCEEVKDYLKVHGNELISQIKSREYKPLPVRRVEIPKPNGGVRKLGIPTVIDRIIQQALVQKLTPIFEPTFSEYSYGFRPNRRCQNAIDRALELLNQGYEWIIDLDLEKFFDNVPQDKLIRLVDNMVNDSDITALIHKYLKAGVLINGEFEETTIGTPQGGNLSPLLSNIYLNELDKELERRGLHFARYADDCVIFVKTENAAKRVMFHIVKFIETKLKLKVNAEKTHITRPNNLKYLGFSFWNDKGKWKSKPHKESFVKLFLKLKNLVKRSWSIDLDYRIKKINEVLRGWVNYYRQSSMKKKLVKIGEWLRNAIRVVIWKQWKLPFTRRQALIKLGLSENEAKCVSNSRKGYQHICHCWSITKAISNSRLKKRGLLDPLEYYLKPVA